LSEGASDRLYRVARVVQMAECVFDSTEKAREWLKNANPALRGEFPLDLLATDAGAELVTDELTRIDRGDLY
jgi:putative toxin-antitoxin system antitoxin component (TIGR02293 family)